MNATVIRCRTEEELKKRIEDNEKRGMVLLTKGSFKQDSGGICDVWWAKMQLVNR